MIILGIDPGTTAIGYALLDNQRFSPRLLAADLISISAVERTERLRELHQGLNKILKRWRPDVVAVERLFFSRNQKTALEVAEAKGVILLTTTLAGVKSYEYTPLEIKRGVTGDGSADKKQIKKMLGLILPGEDLARYQDDILDAVAIALYCSQNTRPGALS